MDDRTIEYGGLTIGAGTDYKIAEISGLSAPPVRSSDRPVARRHGQHPGDDFYEARTITVSTNLVEFNDAAMSTKRAVLAAAFAGGHDETFLKFQIPGVAAGGRRRVLCRPRRSGFVVTKELVAGVARDVFQLHATDPRIYDDISQSAATALPAGSNGLTFPLTFPLVFGATTSGSITANNAGNFNTGALLRVFGPVTNPKIENLTAGASIELELVVASGDYIEIDTAAHTVLLNGTASRYSSLTSTSTWWDITPGDNEIRFQAASTGSAVLSVVWNSAWIA